MVFEFGESINGLIDKILDGPGVLEVAENPIYTAVVIVLVLMLVILIVFRDAETEDPLFTMILRVGFWALLATIGVMMLHNKVLLGKVKKASIDSRTEELFRPQTQLVEEIVPVGVNNYSK